MERTPEEEAEVQAMQDELLKPALRGGGMDWIAKAAAEICGHVHREWLIGKATAIILRHYEAAAKRDACDGKGAEIVIRESPEGIDDEEIHKCSQCGGTGKAVPLG